MRACHTAILRFCQKRAQFCYVPGRFWGALAISRPRCARTSHARTCTAGPARRSAAGRVLSGQSLRSWTVHPGCILLRADSTFLWERNVSSSVSEPFVAWWLVPWCARAFAGILEGTDNRKGTLGRCMREMHGFVCGPLHCFAPPAAYAMAMVGDRGVAGAHGSLPRSHSSRLDALVGERRRTMQTSARAQGMYRSSGLTCTWPGSKGTCRTETYHCRKGNGRIYSTVTSSKS